MMKLDRWLAIVSVLVAAAVVIWALTTTPGPRVVRQLDTMHVAVHDTATVTRFVRRVITERDTVFIAVEDKAEIARLERQYDSAAAVSNALATAQWETDTCLVSPALCIRTISIAATRSTDVRLYTPDAPWAATDTTATDDPWWPPSPGWWTTVIGAVLAAVLTLLIK